MTKNRANKKRKHALFRAVRQKHEEAMSQTGSTRDDDESFIITESDMHTTVATLQAVAAQHVLETPRFKELRRALHPLIMAQIHSYDKGTDYRIKVTQALQQEKWTDASAALSGCRAFQQIPKQGTIQRWVRDCDAADCKIRLYHGILSIGQTNTSADAGVVAADDGKNDQLTILDGWKWWNDSSARDAPGAIGMTAQPMDVSSRIIYQEKAATRQPPNKYDLLLQITPPGIIQWDVDSSLRAVTKTPVPFCPGAFVLDSVFSPNECRQLRTAATQLGFRPDHPVVLPQPTGIDSCEWLVDDSILSVLYSRVKSNLPNNVCDNSILHGINPRWRFFRYHQECIYRPHLDGSWPGSKLVDNNTKYETDDSIKSYMTFLIYLNDNFQGGHTRFYFLENDKVAARGVVPREGAVLVFPQGNTATLIHEGSAVTAGTKFVVRTDVLYCVAKDPSS